MRKVTKIMMVLLGTITVVAIGLVGSWAYIMSNVDEPDYRVVRADGDIEMRDYPALRVAEVRKSGARREAVRAGFSPLASYIFAKNRDGDKIAMTAPVTQTKPDDEWLVHFIMPKDYDLSALPKPANADVTLRELPESRRVAIRFNGVQDDPLIAEKEAILRAWMDKNNLKPLGPATYAYYNDPWTPGPMRRNEVLFEVAR